MLVLQCLCAHVSRSTQIWFFDSQAKKSGYNAIFVEEAKAAEEESDEKATGGFNKSAWEL